MVMMLFIACETCGLIMLLPLNFERNKLYETLSNEHKGILAEFSHNLFRENPAPLLYLLAPLVLFLGSALVDRGGVYTQFLGIGILSFAVWRFVQLATSPFKSLLINESFPKSYILFYDKVSSRIKLVFSLSFIIFIIVWIVFHTFKLTEPAVFRVYNLIVFST